MAVELKQRINFTKMTGSGNDFILIDNRDRLLNADESRDFVQLACRRKLSVGADGMILIENDPKVDFKWRFFNADGSEAEMCGNGARCAARFSYLKGIVKKPVMSFRTLAGIIEAQIAGGRVKLRMTTPNGLEMDLRLQVEEEPFDLHFINTGVPHVVCFVDGGSALENTDVFRWGRALRYHTRFQPAGTNVNFVSVQDPHNITVRTYERGVEAETLACGTGSIASALVGAAKQELASPVEVRTRSGETLTIHFATPRRKSVHDSFHFEDVFLEGEARVVYEAELWDETIK